MGNKIKKEVNKIIVEIIVGVAPVVVEVAVSKVAEILRNKINKIDSVEYDKSSNTVIIDDSNGAIDVESFECEDSAEGNISDIEEIVEKFNNNIQKDEDIKIEQFKGKYYFLSNYYPCTVNYRGITYNSVEGAFQSMKTRDIKIRKEFAELLPKEAKQKGRTINLRHDWESIKYEVMFNICMAKFSQNIDLSNKLLNTKDAYLEQGSSWGDKEWGVINGVGKNKLGEILMRVREELRKDI